MRFVARVDVYMPGDIVERAPGAWDRLKALWQPVDLGTERMRNRVEGATFVYELRGALEALGIRNARSLVVDGTTVFHDARGVDGDLPDLVLALSDHVSLFGDRSQELRLSVEHEEAGLRLQLDAVVTSEHGREAPAARIDVEARPAELDPQAEERAEDYRARIEALVGDPRLRAALGVQFEAFVTRLRGALERAFVETRFDVATSAQEGFTPSARTLPTRSGERGATAPLATAAPARNFSMSSEQRIGALISGPPPYAVRARRIEDLEEDLVAALAECERAGSQSIPIAVARRLDEANALVRDHNLYYPVERNLPLDTATGGLLEMGEPWRPKAALTLDDLRARARVRLGWA